MVGDDGGGVGQGQESSSCREPVDGERESVVDSEDMLELNESSSCTVAGVEGMVVFLGFHPNRAT